MPATADTRAALPATGLAAPRRRARTVLLAALGLGLAGLAVPGSPAATTTATAPVVLSAAAGVALDPVPHPTAARPVPADLQAAVRAAAARRAQVRASRTRRALWVRPCSAPVNSAYGPRWGRMHWGIDFACHYGAPIYAVGDGVVVGAGYLPNEGGYGQLILVRHAGGVITAYAHTSRMLVHAGQRVRAGQVIGLVGATGHVTGPHLHFEVRIGGRKISPRPWLLAHGIRV